MARILIVDDENTVRQLLKRALLLSRHEVVEASDGKDALAKFITEKKPFDLIITDMMMPGTDGFSLVEEIASLDPHAKVIIMSGWFSEEELNTTKNEVSNCIRGILQKPCSMEEIQTVLKKVIEED